jgi:hypothetical protein
MSPFDPTETLLGGLSSTSMVSGKEREHAKQTLETVRPIGVSYLGDRGRSAGVLERNLDRRLETFLLFHGRPHVRRAHRWRPLPNSALQMATVSLLFPKPVPMPFYGDRKSRPTRGFRSLLASKQLEEASADLLRYSPVVIPYLQEVIADLDHKAWRIKNLCLILYRKYRSGHNPST